MLKWSNKKKNSPEETVFHVKCEIIKHVRSYVADALTLLHVGIEYLRRIS